MPTRLTDADHVLSILRAWKGDWTPHLYQTAGVMVHSRVADLRRRGHEIECKRFGAKDYRYRLVRDAESA